MEHQLIGNHPSMQKIRELINLVSDTAFNVLLQGETGTGKEVVARLLHASSSRRHKRFVKVNCAALPLSLLESELFGYEKGAFTGADKLKPGRFELASGGAIFLDEIGDMPLVLQGKLLQVLQSGEFTRLGGTEDLKVNAWTISATHHDLEKDIKLATFREDLYYRLNIIKIELPPLRDRKEDIPLLTEHFIKKYRKQLKVGSSFTLSDETMKLFQVYHWPGNVRELASSIMRLMVGDHPEKVKFEFLSNMKSDEIPLPVDILPTPSDELVKKKHFRQGITKPKSLKELKAEATKYIEKKVITEALNMTGWNKVETARKLKISYKALFYKMNDFGIRDLRKE